MPDVRGDHEHAAVADARHAAAGLGARVNGDVFAKDVAIADPDAGRRPAVFQVLRRGADHDEGEQLVAAAQLDVPGEGDVVVQPAARADHHVRPDHAERADLDVVGDLRRRVHFAEVTDLWHLADRPGQAGRRPPP